MPTQPTSAAKLVFKPSATAKSAASDPSPVGEGWGEGILRIVATFLNNSTTEIQAFRLVTPSLALSHGREDGVAVGVKGSSRKIGCAGCFLFFRRPEINGCKPKLPFKSPKFAKSAATCSLSRGRGLGRGHSPNFGNLSQQLNHRNTSLAACCPLSSSLPRGERTGWLLGLRVLQGKQVVQAAFCFSDGLYKCSIQSACTL